MTPTRTLVASASHSFLFVMLPILITGCEHQSHREIVADAEQNWNALRSDMRVRLATQQLESGRIDAAAESLQEAISVYPDDPDMHRLLARCHLERGDQRSAREALTAAVTLGDDSADLHYTQGRLLEFQGRYAEALDSFIRAASLAPDNVDYLVAAAEMYVQEGQPEQARLLLSGDFGDVDHDPKLLLMRAGVLELLGAFSEASDDYRVLLQLMDSQPWLVQSLALTLMRQGRYAEALAAVIPFLDAGQDVRAPADDETALALPRLAAECHVQLDQFGEARRILRDYLQDRPEDSRAWWLLAEASTGLNDLGEVRKCARAGRKLNPELPHWDVLDAYVLWKQGRAPHATAILERVIESHPGHAPAHCFLGKVLTEGNDATRARQHLEIAARLSSAQPQHAANRAF